MHVIIRTEREFVHNCLHEGLRMFYTWDQVEAHQMIATANNCSRA